jgi:signal transduction histidine kinase
MAEGFRQGFPDMTLELDLQCPEFIVMIDPDQMQQVMANLVLNALEASPTPAKLHIATRCQGDEIRLEVHDSGPGIPREIRSQVFNPFFTTKAEGTGLGLAIVSQIVTGHSGQVIAGESPLGGAMMAITLPLKSTVGD